MQDAEGFDKVDSLVPSLKICQGSVFARFARKGVPLVDFPARMASHRLGEMRYIWRMALDVACN